MDRKFSEQAAAAAQAGKKWARNSVLAVACAAMLALPMANVAQASFLKSMMNTFVGDMSNVTPGGAYHNATRGMFTGGSIYTRTKIFNSNVVSFTPPSFNAGCGGIDMFGGAFSFINAEQLIQLLRSIVANAAPVLFYIAVSYISEKIAKVMAKFQDIIQKLNTFLSNSCRLATGIATDIADAIGLPHSSDAPSAKSMFHTTMEGVKQDWGDVMDMFTISKGGSPSPQQSVATKEPEKAKELGVYGNVVWKALQKENMSGGSATKLMSSFGTSAKTIRQEILSVAGSVILTKPASTSSSQSASGSGSNSTDSSQIQRILAPKISLKDMVTGNTGRQVEYWVCNNDDCDNPTTGSLSDVPVGGFTQQIYQKLCGDAACSGGIIGKLASDGKQQQDNMTTDEANFMGSLPGNFNSKITRLATAIAFQSGTTGSAYEFGKRLSGVLASYLAHEMIHQTLIAAEQSLANVQGDGVEQATAQIQKSREKCDSDYNDLKSRYGDFNNLYQMAENFNQYGDLMPFSPMLESKLNH